MIPAYWTEYLKMYFEDSDNISGNIVIEERINIYFINMNIIQMLLAHSR